MPLTAEETRKAVSDVRATLRRIADALDEIAGTLAAMYRDSKKEEN